ncbi:MAG: tetratricopeptide repeat protein, partial [Planctomycetota bacterium]
MKIINTHLIWIFLLIFCIIAGCGSKADHHNKQGLIFYNKRKYDEAIVEFKKALELNPRHYDAHFNLGAAYSSKNMPDESILELRKAVDVDPNEPKAHYNIAFAYMLKEKVADAISEYQKAIELFAARKDKKEAEGYLYMAVAYSLIEKQEE